MANATRLLGEMHVLFRFSSLLSPYFGNCKKKGSNSQFFSLLLIEKAKASAILQNTEQQDAVAKITP
jgi:hypothetical protein